MNQINAWIPRCLIAWDKNELPITSNIEGLSHVCLEWAEGKVKRVRPLSNEVLSSHNLVLPRLVEPHAHLDKVFTWKDFPNFSGNYCDAYEANLLEHSKRTKTSVTQRAERALWLAMDNGLRAIRTHIDSFGSVADQSWESLSSLKVKWKGLVDMQLVALTPIGYWSTREGIDFAKRIAPLGALLGGVLLPPFHKPSIREELKNMLALADHLGCGVDIHVDEGEIHPAAGLTQLLDVLDHMTISCSVTCSHVSSMGLLSPNRIRRMADRLAFHGVGVVALPLTNGWLLGGNRSTSSSVRPFAPIKELQQAGVVVAIGGDNVQDSWFPVGNLDPLMLMAISLVFAQTAPWERLGIAPFTTSAANLMDLDWEGTFQVGSPAEFVILQADSWSKALASPPKRKVMIDGVLYETPKKYSQ